mgnify:CR=1 FL=1
MASDGTREPEPGAFLRFFKGMVPLVIIASLLFLTAKDPDPVTGVVMLVLSGLVLWFGWDSVRRSRGTRWFGVLLALYIGSLMGIFAIALIIRVGLLFFPLLLLALPLLIYDLLFRAPFKGRFERARAERRHLHEQ